MNFKGKMREKSGITLITLAITIIILLILAGITIGAITGDNGLIKNARNAKEQTEIAEEKEIVDRATLQAIGKNKYGNIDEGELQDELNKITNDGKTEVSDNGEEFEVVFVDSNRYYNVDKDGNITEEGKIVIDKSPGNITVGLNGETLPENEYQIWSIEDLVILSNISRGKGNYIENGEIKNTTRNTFSGCKVKLMRSLNFNSKLSYADLSIGWSYDETNEAYIIDETSTQNLRELLMDKDGVGFIPISVNTGNDNLMFAGIFDGQNYEIENLYQNNITAGGLFSTLYLATVKNLKLTNIDITSSGAGGIVQRGVDSHFYNCCVTGNIYKRSISGRVDWFNRGGNGADKLL